MGLNHEKTGGRKFSDTLPLSFLFVKSFLGLNNDNFSGVVFENPIFKVTVHRT